MSTYQPTEGIRIEMGPDLLTAETRTARGVMIASQAKLSPLYATPDVQTAVDTVITDTTDLKTAVDAYTTAYAAFRKARSALTTITGEWDGSFRILVAAAEKHCTTSDEATGLGLAVLGKTKYALVAPLGIQVTYDAKKGVVRIHVKRAPGMRAVCVEISTDPSMPGSWTELAGYGAKHEVKVATPGILWVRAASRTAKAKSDFTGPVSVIVK